MKIVYLMVLVLSPLVFADNSDKGFSIKGIFLGRSTLEDVQRIWGKGSIKTAQNGAKRTCYSFDSGSVVLFATHWNAPEVVHHIDVMDKPLLDEYRSCPLSNNFKTPPSFENDIGLLSTFSSAEDKLGKGSERGHGFSFDFGTSADGRSEEFTIQIVKNQNNLITSIGVDKLCDECGSVTRGGDCIKFNSFWVPKAHPNLSAKINGIFRYKRADDGSFSLTRVSRKKTLPTIVKSNSDMGDSADSFSGVESEFIAKGKKVRCP